ncbi:helix-turn-helix domain-containing protein [Acidobacteria bacterium AH-259-L09]|nr:helix-turn-helix domain-containing protein [Acidobacteria bacterium AH-259-L09]
MWLKIPSTDEPFRGTNEAAAIIGVKPDTLRKWAGRGQVTSYRISNRLKFLITELVKETAARRPRKPNPYREQL